MHVNNAWEDLQERIPVVYYLTVYIVYFSSFVTFYLALISFTSAIGSDYIFPVLGVFVVMYLFNLARELRYLSEKARKQGIGVYIVFLLAFIGLQPLGLVLSLLTSVLWGFVIYVLAYHQPTQFVFKEAQMLTRYERENEKILDQEIFN